MTVKIKKIGGSMAIIIPRDIAHNLALSPGTTMSIVHKEGTITMRKAASPTRRQLREIVAELDKAAYERRRTDDLDDAVAGAEVW